jgi:1,4-alpha-glucan branching enzyme
VVAAPVKHHVIYQLHPLRFTNRNQHADGQTLPPLLQIADELDNDGHHDYLNDVGVTAIQLMPVSGFPGDHSWGYNPSFFYVIESAYGEPDYLKKLVDTAHSNGIAVILDLVYNHGGVGDNILWQIAQQDPHHGTYYDGDTKWGPMINFDGDVARDFFVQNFGYLAREYRVDGFRFDFTRPIHNRSDDSIRVRDRVEGGGSFARYERKRRRLSHAA